MEGVDECPLLNQSAAEVVQPFWAALQAGEFLTDAAAVAGTHRWRGLQWLREAGGSGRRGLNPNGRCLTFAEREEIALGRAAGESMRSIAARISRDPSAVRRERAGNSDSQGRHRATVAHAKAYERAAARSRRSWHERGAAGQGRAGSAEAPAAGRVPGHRER